MMDCTVSGNGMHELKLHSQEIYYFFLFTSTGIIGIFRLLSFTLFKLGAPL
jgi:hypothetical protein